MVHQLRAELYKLTHTKAFYLTLLLVLCVFGIFLMGGEQQFVASSISTGDPWEVGKTVGFIARSYTDIQHPSIEEIIRTATSYTVFFWLIVLIFAVSFFSREYADSTMKIVIASGQSRITFFLAKYLVISITSLALYALFILSAFLIECLKIGEEITLQHMTQMLEITLLNCLVLLALIGLILLCCVAIRHTAIVVGILSFFVFTGPLVYMMIWDTMQTQPWGLILYVKVNPMYYWMNTCSYHIIPHLKASVVTYFLVVTLSTLLISFLLLRKQEIR